MNFGAIASVILEIAFFVAKGILGFLAFSYVFNISIWGDKSE